MIVKPLSLTGVPLGFPVVTDADKQQLVGILFHFLRIFSAMYLVNGSIGRLVDWNPALPKYIYPCLFAYMIRLQIYVFPQKANIQAKNRSVIDVVFTQ